ncbi:MAG: quinolinate synthase NadA [Ruminococcaceae bacterium]|nr:quinolinate synthase NadA [Oscillospiraceae bacterium]
MDNMLKERINKLKQERNAVIVAHMYQNDDVQEIADMVGDSFALSKYCMNRPENTIVFCGVDFMAESAKILSPEKTVLIPVAGAGCAMADMITAEQLKEFKKQYPGYAVATYINSSAAVKAESDVIVTSSNALKVIQRMSEKNILFCPDRNLGNFIAKQCPDKNIVIWQGFCPIHHKIQKEDVVKIKDLYPNAELLVHPECTPEVTALADYAGSTKGIIDYATASDSEEFIIGTEIGVMYQLKKNNPYKKFYIMSEELICPNMKKTTIESIVNCLEKGENEVFVPENVAKRAKIALDRMLELGK